MFRKWQLKKELAGDGTRIPACRQAGATLAWEADALLTPNIGSYKRIFLKNYGKNNQYLLFTQKNNNMLWMD